MFFEMILKLLQYGMGVICIFFIEIFIQNRKIRFWTLIMNAKDNFQNLLKHLVEGEMMMMIR